MVDKIKKRLKKIDDKYPAISAQCHKYIENNSKIDENNNINIFHRPWVAPQNWGIKLFESVNSKWIKDFKTRTEKSIPDFYKDFLKISNGGFIYDLSLYGLPPSIYTKGVLSRSMLQCHDLTSANNNWIVEYDIDRNSFYFGGRAHTFEENVGYFFHKNEIILHLSTMTIKHFIFLLTAGPVWVAWIFNSAEKWRIESGDSRLIWDSPSIRQVMRLDW